MRKGFSKFLAGILSAALFLSTVNYPVSAEEGSRTATASESGPEKSEEEPEEPEDPKESESPEEPENPGMSESPEETGSSEETESPEETGSSKETEKTDPTESPDTEPTTETEETTETESTTETEEITTEEPTEEETTEETTEEETTEEGTAEEQSAEEAVEVKGSLDVRIIAGFRMEKDQEFTVALAESGEKKIKLPKSKNGSSKVPEASAGFSELEAGTYELSVSGDGYDTYKQQINVENNLAYRIQIYAGELPVLEENIRSRVGLIVRKEPAEDVDADAIVDAIWKEDDAAEYDLNRDGFVDLRDLNYFTRFFENVSRPQSQEAEPEKHIVVYNDVLDVGDGTSLKGGTLEGAVSGDARIKLSPKEGKEISEDSPVEVSFEFSKYRDPVKMEGIIIKSPEKTAISEGEVTVVYDDEDGEEREADAVISQNSGTYRASRQRDLISAACDGSGTLVINLSGQIAVKRVTLRITKTTTENPGLAEISSVQFLNDMESRIPEPVMNVPTGLRAVPGSRSFTLSWERQQNVTGYEIAVSADGKEPEYRRTAINAGVMIKQFGKEELINNTEYTVKVQSVNGEWKSGFSSEIKVTPKATKVPDAPDQVSVTGSYRSITVKWKAVKDADSYNLYYKEDGAEAFTKIAGIKSNSYQIDNLKDDTKYTAYVTGTNELGEGPASLTAADKTTGELTEVKLPEYKLINTSNGEGVLSSHIKSAVISGGTMVDSPLDEGNSALGLFDNNFYSYAYREDWDWGGAYPADTKSITTELDKVYDIGMITFAEPVDLGAYSKLTVYYRDGSGAKKKAENVSIHQKTSGSRKYYMIKFKEPMQTSEVQFGVGRADGRQGKVTISEIRFYKYDSIEQDILNLYADDLHISLKDTVTAGMLQELQDRLDTKDSASGEYHPERDALQKELDAAKKLLETGGLGGVVQVNPMLASSKDSGISVGGLNAWQPLGVSAAAGEEIVVYVGNPDMKEGATAKLQLVFTQYYAESNGLSATQNLKIGRNEITVPRIATTDKERGGALYVQYTGNNDNDSYAVRVSGGTGFPVLNLYHVSDKERSERIAAYVKELKSYVAALESQHDEVHGGSENENVNYDYDAKRCILNTTDIQTDKMMLSIPASQALAGLGSSGQEAKLADSVQAMDDMMTLFYQHKGLADSFAEGTGSAVIAKNHTPYRYLNIRYMKMFAGAFMYASGNHIGIEWGSTTGVVSGVPVECTEAGKYTGGRYFGWGIAHEIGHQINQGDYAHAEVTNNYFAVLAQAKDTNDSVRFKYSEVFKKVTSGAEGYADNVFTQLGMYWQLHLAYDKGYNYRTYGTYQEIMDNLFFARVDSYARNPASAPAPNGTKLSLDGGRDQNLMRLAAAAAERDLSEFFIRWGMTPDTETKAYMKQFKPEERAIYYVDDEARVYKTEHGTAGAVTGKDAVTVKISAKDSKVTLTMTPGVDSEVLQGYEITRVFIEQGKERKQVCGFTQTNTFTDSAAFAANRVITYEVTAIDKFMNRSKVYRTDAVKTGGDGIQDKSVWTVFTNMDSKDDHKEDATEEKPCEPATVSAAEKMIDDSSSTTFVGTAAGEDPYILLELNRSVEVTALRYTLSGSGQAITRYKVEVSGDGKTYKEVKTGTFGLKDGSETIYFENGTDKWVCTYDAAFVKLTAVGQKGKELSVTEFDLYGPSGDNVEFMSAQDGSGIGKLKSDYQYGTKSSEKIPAGSIVFTGTYKGNPAYNVVVLYDENGRIVGGKAAEGSLTAHQIILAPDPGNAMLGDTSDGTWIYWIEPDSGVSETSLSKKVRAELYRVDNALTNEGQRLVSDTKFVELPEKLPEILLDK